MSRLQNLGTYASFCLGRIAPIRSLTSRSLNCIKLDTSRGIRLPLPRSIVSSATIGNVSRPFVLNSSVRSFHVGNVLLLPKKRSSPKLADEQKSTDEEYENTTGSSEMNLNVVPEVSEVMIQRNPSSSGSTGTELVRQDPNQIPKEVVAIPVFRRPIFPGIATPIALTNSDFSETLLKLRNIHGNNFYVGLFLTKDNYDREDRTISSADEIHEIGCLAQVLHVQAVHPMGIQLLVAGTGRVLITGTVKREPFLTVSIERLQDKLFDPNDKIIKAYMLEIMATVKSIVKLEHFFKEQLQAILTQVTIQNPSHLADITASMTTADRSSLQEILECLDIQDRLTKTLNLLKVELEQAEVQKTIHKQMEEKISKSQRKHYLAEQLKIIKKELGLEVDEKEELIQKISQKLAEINPPEAAEKVIQDQMKKLSMLEAASSEYNMTRSYLDWLISIPWGVSTEDSLDVQRAKEILDKDHHGMKDVKERILESIAVGMLKGTISGKILCFNGPPGVGKTSIGKAIASALNRKFFRFSVGGLSDVSEIKGHRRTYVGAMPGKLVQALKSAGSNNPVIMLDEIDKLGRGYQGDPASALLEVLDPSQNSEFLDHYMDISIDLSKCFFICTSNDLSTVPDPLKDRMEIIQVSGYAIQDKIAIAMNHLLPKGREEMGLTAENSQIQPDAMVALINKYCREPGVRNLQKQIEKLLRKISYKIATKECDKVEVTCENLESFIGAPLFPKDKIFETTPEGVVMGLAWTSLGGSTLFIECLQVSTAEKGNLQMTGKMGEVMKESAEISYSVARKFLSRASPENNFLEKNIVHLHIPEGAVPKDGPSAGITMVTALLSLAMNKKIEKKLAMTGEVTLTGKVLPVGGIKEKVLAAQRAGVEQVIIPIDNKRDWEELDEQIKENMHVSFASTYDDVYQTVFGSN
mmetsp:Transcript_13202/g.46246  ORF Transcript_13202/g.46246 Transcript_13202/m.46246 type:complete len:924 (+) Transcript_13202:98-2869(+)